MKNVYTILGCVTEEDIVYWGNDLSSMKQPDVASCRASCRSAGAGYFTYSLDNTRGGDHTHMTNTAVGGEGVP